MKRHPVSFESHQAERRRRGSLTLGSNTCCCCCCCLHSVGALIGAAVAPSIGSGRPPSLLYYDEEEASLAPTLPPATGVKTVESAIQAGHPRPTVRLEGDEDRPSMSLPAGNRGSAVALFWWLLVALSVVGLLWGVQTGIGGPGGWKTGVGIALLILALTLPAVQLGSAFLVLFVLLFSRRIDRPYRLKQLGKITLGTILGTLAGVLLMYLIYVLMKR
jgi:hypothetical protein